MARLYHTMGNHMADRYTPRNRGPNCSVQFDLAEFTQRLFACLGSSAQFTGPGPTQLGWLPADTTPRERFAVNYLAENLYSKFDDGKPSEEKRKAAIRKFKEGELACALTNFKFEPTAGGQPPAWLEPEEMLPDGYSLEDSSVFLRARRLISKVLGSFPGWDAVLEQSDFGPGATTRLSRRDGDRSNKWAGRPHATSFVSSSLETLFGALPLVRSRIGSDGTLSEIVQGNKLDWVPKNYKIDRTIAIEPDWNMFLQKGVGTLIRRRLKIVGQDLDDQETNRFLAAVGSIDGSVACLDLSMASDTVAYRLVEFLLPDDWFAVLEQLRSPIGSYKLSDGSVEAVIFEKFSSMGNGFTFELESLIFWGILRAVSELSGETDLRTYVYGDDIVVPTGIAGLAMSYLEKAGFVVNRDKSSWCGPFRESCGGHYFDGCEVTPFYVREAVDTLDRLFLLHNNVWRWFQRQEGISDVEDVRGLLLWIRSHAPHTWRRPRLLSGTQGDGGFIGSFDEVLPKWAGRSRKRAGWEGWWVETLQYRAKRKPLPGEIRTRGGKRQAKQGSDYRSKHPEGCPACPICEPSCYPTDAGPDLASLWRLEKGNHGKWLLRERYQRGAGRGWMNNLSFIQRLLPGRTGSGDVPHAERYWYTAGQVLPLECGTSWF